VSQAKASTQPQNLDVEASLLGSLLIDSDAFIKIGDMIRADDFFDVHHSKIFEAMHALHEKRSPIDILTLSEQLKNAQQLDAIGGQAI
jgi:replicative DNA helicase